MFFLYEDRAYDAGEVGERIDNVVRGLLSIGVRQGEHVGVLMGARPSALALVAAINRIGAVAVLMRPDGDPRREAALGQIERIVADPERAELAAELEGVETFVLGGGGAPAGPGDRASHRHGADRPGRGDAAALVPAEPRARRRSGVHRVQRRG